MTEQALAPAPATEIGLSELLRRFAPARARKHPRWSWADEEQSIRTRMCLCCGRPGHYQELVEAHVAAHGLDGLGVYLGDDGFAADGHHRIVAAIRLGLERIPLETKAAAEARWVKDHGYVDWHHRRFGDD